MTGQTYFHLMLMLLALAVAGCEYPPNVTGTWTGELVRTEQQTFDGIPFKAYRLKLWTGPRCYECGPYMTDPSMRNDKPMLITGAEGNERTWYDERFREGDFVKATGRISDYIVSVRRAPDDAPPGRQSNETAPAFGLRLSRPLKQAARPPGGPPRPGMTAAPGSKPSVSGTWRGQLITMQPAACGRIAEPVFGLKIWEGPRCFDAGAAVPNPAFPAGEVMILTRQKRPWSPEGISPGEFVEVRGSISYFEVGIDSPPGARSAPSEPDAQAIFSLRLAQPVRRITGRQQWK